MSGNSNISAALQGLNQWLQREQHAGREAMWLPPETLQRLQDLPALLASQQVAQPAPTAAVPAVVPTPVAPRAPAAPQPAATASPSAAPPGPAASAEPATAAAQLPRRERLNALAREAKRDQQCLNLGTLRETMVFASGNPDADIMFVGEAPGYEEEQQKKPFVGPAGQLLVKIIEAMGFTRDDVYISNIVKFRPKIDDGVTQARSNRKPTAGEMAASIRYIKAEIEIVQPKVIVALGGTAAKGLLNLDGSVGNLRNQFHDFHGTPVMVTFHPSYLLYRQKEGPEAVKAEKRKVWDDMQMVLTKIR